MLLAIDVGNTHTVIGLFRGAELAAHWRIATVADRTADEHRLWLQNIIGMEGFGKEHLAGVAVASVVPAATSALREVVPHVADGPVVIVGPGIKTGMPILIDNPHEVGADRVVNAVAAYDRYGGPAIVVDFGTATTFDVVSGDGEYIGGAIAPGLEVSVEALHGATAALRTVEFRPPRTVIGKGTVEALQSGIIYGYSGLVDGINERIAAVFSDPVQRVATGGLASTIVPHCRTVETVDEFLTLEGLRLVFERNREI
jgi:type III pantothenate kinase